MVNNLNGGSARDSPRFLIFWSTIRNYVLRKETLGLLAAFQSVERINHSFLFALTTANNSPRRWPRERARLRRLRGRRAARAGSGRASRSGRSRATSTAR